MPNGDEGNGGYVSKISAKEFFKQVTFWACKSCGLIQTWRYPHSPQGYAIKCPYCTSTEYEAIV